MTEIEKATLSLVADLTRLLCEVGDTQTKLVAVILEKLPDSDSGDLLASAKITQLQLQSLRQNAETLKAAL